MPTIAETLAARADELASRREPFVHATVVRAQRPTSAHAGDTALVLPTGEIQGFVGGNCVEESVREYSLQVLASQEPLLLRVLPGEPSRTAEEGAVEVSNPCLSGGAIEIFLQPRIPAPRVLVVGTTPVAQALATLGSGVGLDVELTDGEDADPRGDDAALIVASHGKAEEGALEAGLRAGVPYVALVASGTRGAAVLESLDVDDALRRRVFTPAGLQLGARTPGEIALSILAQLVGERSKARHAAPPPAAAAAPLPRPRSWNQGRRARLTRCAACPSRPSSRPCMWTTTASPSTSVPPAAGPPSAKIRNAMPSRREPLAGAAPRTAGIILAAGASRRLGRPKQLLPYGSGVLLDAVLATARDCAFSQTVLALGGAAAEVERTVDTSGCDVVLNPDYGDGCASSIATALAALHPDTDAVVLLLGDQPGVRASSVRAVLGALQQPGSGAPSAGAVPNGLGTAAAVPNGQPGIAVCRYDDGVGHPLAFARRLLPDLAALHGDKGVWRLLEQRADDVVEVRTPGPVPLDVDTEDDYRRLLAGLQGAL